MMAGHDFSLKRYLASGSSQGLSSSTFTHLKQYQYYNFNIELLIWALPRAPELHSNIHQLVKSSDNSTKHEMKCPRRTNFQPGQFNISYMACSGTRLLPPPPSPSAFDKSLARERVYLKLVVRAKIQSIRVTLQIQH